MQLLINWSEPCVDIALCFKNFIELYLQGTWQFMSAVLLSDLDVDQEIVDDWELAFYVLLYLGLLYTKHNQVLQKLESYMEIFDYVTVAHNNVPTFFLWSLIFKYQRPRWQSGFFPVQSGPVLVFFQS